MSDWIDPQPVVIPDALRSAVGGHPLVAETLAHRGFTSPDSARAFLDPDYYVPSPAADLPDLTHAVERIWQALRAGEHIAIWGDFDVDGQTSTAVLVEALRWLSSRSKLQQILSLSYQVPLRQQGHGVHLPSLAGLLDQGVTLLITCDTGVDAFTAVERAATRGCDVIITDHHDLPASLPPACAVVNPNRLAKEHALRHLPGVGVAYKLVEGLFASAGYDTEVGELLDLVALGIVADVATQVADVRYLLQRGLEVLRTTQRVGLQALLEQAELDPKGLSEEHIAYQLAPRLNALGRLGDANEGVQLLLTQNLTQARVLAAQMDGLNYERRLIASQVLQATLQQVERNPSLLDYRALVLASNDWHVGILGPVAGRLAERFQRPAIVLSVSPDGLARGSARSVPGCDIRAAIEQTAHLLIRFGGHPGAAGLTLDPLNIDSFRKALSRAVIAVWDSKAASPGLQIDAQVSLDQLSVELADQLDRLAPFGPGNPPVQLATHNLRLVADSIIGRNEEHRRLVVADEQGTQQTVLWWQGGDQPLPEGWFDLAYTVRSRDYRGEAHLQVEWIDARPRERVGVAFEQPKRQVIDWRRETDPKVLLDRIPRGSVALWAEGEDSKTLAEIGGVDRLKLTPSSILVVWTAPPGPAELVEVIGVVDPEVVYVIALQPPVTGLRPFLERLTGMLSYDLRARAGHVSVSRLAAALGQREATIRAGVEWLAARGQVQVVEAEDDGFALRAGGQPSTDLRAVEARLRRLINESDAYRRHFRSAPVATLGVSG
jgi:single-stranded-DNA-specific exonuclease